MGGRVKKRAEVGGQSGGDVCKHVMLWIVGALKNAHHVDETKNKNKVR